MIQRADTVIAASASRMNAAATAVLVKPCGPRYNNDLRSILESDRAPLVIQISPGPDSAPTYSGKEAVFSVTWGDLLRLSKVLL
jgi:hypothetical protein